MTSLIPHTTSLLILSTLTLLSHSIYLNNTYTPFVNPDIPSNDEYNHNRMTLVFSAPGVGDPYYAEFLTKIVEFQIEYANKVLGHDNVIILVDDDTVGMYQGKVPEDILLRDGMRDIWARDFTTVNPWNPVTFMFTSASMNEGYSSAVKAKFDALVNKYDVHRKLTDFKLDGGNMVDNYRGRGITTTKFLTDNGLDKDAAIEVIKELLGYNEVAIIDPDDNILAHSDGMVAWISENQLLVNKYDDEDFNAVLLEQLSSAFPGAEITPVPVKFFNNPCTQNIASACNANLNLVYSIENLYVPVFNNPEVDNLILDIIKSKTNRKVIPVRSDAICCMGGNVRCTTWQLVGDNAVKIIQSARKPT